MAKIYTKTGDKGETSLFTGKRVPKNDQFIEALGTVDECNSAIGVALAHMPRSDKFKKSREQLEIIQHALFDVGAAVATPLTSAKADKIKMTRFDGEAIQVLELWIDAMQAELPELHAFILPGGESSGAMLHLARGICRRAERVCVPLNLNGDINDDVLKYLNRLSDYLFVVSRYVNQLANSPETLWQHHKKGG